MSDRVLLTGVSGFLGGHIALQLLNAGYTVRGSVRNLSKADKVKATLSKAGADISRLEFVALDLLSDTGWDAAMVDCRFLLHTASPFVIQTPKDPQELIRPAVQGTERAINAALKAGIERIVLTSSTAAVQYGHGDDKLSMTEADWTNLSSNRVTAYARSKTLAEQRAWELMDAAGRRDDLAVINPSVILGPLLDDDEGSSSVVVKRLLDGKLPATPRFSFSIIDVRDVAALHIDAMTNPAAAGQRCIGAAGMLSMSELGRAIKPAFPGRRVPTRDIPDWLVRIVALFDTDIAGAVNELGKPQRLVGSRGLLRLGRPLIQPTDAAIATGKSLIEHHLV